MFLQFLLRKKVHTPKSLEKKAHPLNHSKKMYTPQRKLFSIYTLTTSVYITLLNYLITACMHA